jgi:hypothetical protein
MTCIILKEALHNIWKATVALFLEAELQYNTVWTTGIIAKFIAAKIPSSFNTYTYNTQLSPKYFSVMH